MSRGPAIVGEMTLRGLLRRRASLALLLLLPLTFYLIRHEQPWQSVRFLAIGVAWATSTAALFAAVGTRSTEPRLRVSGWSWPALLAGRVAAMLTLSLTLALVYFVIVAIDRPVGNTGVIGLLLLVSALTGIAVGSALGAFVSRELDGALLLFILAGLQMMVDPATSISVWLPFWSSRELATVAIEGPDAASTPWALLHMTLVLSLCAAATWTLTRRRLAAPAGERGRRVH